LIDSLTGYPLSNEIWWTIKTFNGKFVSVGTHYNGNWNSRFYVAVLRNNNTIIAKRKFIVLR